ncbi:MAG: DNA/RNA nuclease SfsA [Holophagaceae bacterium]
MKIANDLIIGTIIKRYKRFLVDVELPNGQIVTSHSTNTGSMTSCWEPGDPALIKHVDDPNRKLKYTLIACKREDTWVGVDTASPQRLILELLESGDCFGLKHIKELRTEVKYGSESSRIDIWGRCRGQEIYIEIKNTTLKRGRWVSFPDAVTERGTKHLRELQKMISKGHRAALIYVVQRNDVSFFDVARDIDPQYYKEWTKAVRKGLEIYPIRFELVVSKTKGQFILKWVPKKLLPIKTMG